MIGQHHLRDEGVVGRSEDIGGLAVFGHLLDAVDTAGGLEEHGDAGMFGFERSFHLLKRSGQAPGVEDLHLDVFGDGCRRRGGGRRLVVGCPPRAAAEQDCGSDDEADKSQKMGFFHEITFESGLFLKLSLFTKGNRNMFTLRHRAGCLTRRVP